jgi:hypothetical protein
MKGLAMKGWMGDDARTRDGDDGDDDDDDGDGGCVEGNSVRKMAWEVIGIFLGEYLTET